MLYLEYEEYLSKQRAAQDAVDELLREKEELFQRTQPKGTDYTADKVKTSGGASSFEVYLMAKERTHIDERLDEAMSILDGRVKLTGIKLDELRKSNQIQDRVYRMRYVDRWKVRRIAKAVSYSEMQVYRILKEIVFSLKDVRKC